jgi:hypothetical protein
MEKINHYIDEGKRHLKNAFKALRIDDLWLFRPDIPAKKRYAVWIAIAVLGVILLLF